MALKSEMILKVKDIADDPVDLRFTLDTDGTFKMILDGVEQFNCAFSSLDFTNTTTLQNDLLRLTQKGR